MCIPDLIRGPGQHVHAVLRVAGHALGIILSQKSLAPVRLHFLFTEGLFTHARFTGPLLFVGGINHDLAGIDIRRAQRRERQSAV